MSMTSVFIANKLGVPIPRYRSWERQLGPATEKQYIDALARILQVDPQWLAYGKGVPPEGGVPDDSVAISLTPEERGVLGKRALERREAIKLTRHQVAMRIGVPTQILKNWEFNLPQKRKDIEAKWELVLGVPEGWLRAPDMVAPEPSSAVRTQVVVANADSVAGEIRMAAVWLSRANFARRTAEYSELVAAERRHADIFSLRYGVDGEENAKLQAVGDRIGLTRERIRQIVEKMIERAPRLKLETPFIDRLAKEIKPHLPATVELLDGKFRHILGESLSIVSVDRFCREVLGRNIVVMTDRPADMTLKWSPTVIDPENHNADRIRAVRDVSMRMIRCCGAAQVFFVAGAAGEAFGLGVLPGDVVRDCRTIPGFEWLNERDGWFWYGEAKENRLVTVATKILAASGQRIDAEEILAGFIRSRRGYYEPEHFRPYMIEPPLQVVVEVLRRTKGLVNIQYDDFYLESPIPVETVLSETERAVYGLLKTNGNIISRHSLNTQLVDSGQIKFMALQVSLNNSPIYRHIDWGVFALRGAPLSPESLREAKDSVGGDGTKAISLTECDQDGFFHLDCELTEYMVKNRFWSVPAKLARLMGDGEYALEGFAEPVIFTRGSSGSNRLKRFLSKALSLGLKAGDRFDLAVDPKSRRIRMVKTDLSQASRISDLAPADGLFGQAMVGRV